MVDVNGLLTEAEAQVISSVVGTITSTVAAEAAKIAPELVAVGSALVSKVKSAISEALTGTLTPDQYAQLELDEQADITESAQNMGDGDVPPPAASTE